MASLRVTCCPNSQLAGRWGQLSTHPYLPLSCLPPLSSPLLPEATLPNATEASVLGSVSQRSQAD